MIFESLSDIARQEPDRVAIIQKQRRVTYGELDNGVSCFAAFLLNKGIRKGDRVCIISENSPEYIISYFGTQKAGGVSVAINPQYSSYEMKNILLDCLPGFIIVEKKCLKTLIASLEGVTGVITIIISDHIGEEVLSSIRTKTDNIQYIDMILLQTVLQGGDKECSFPAITNKKDLASIIYTSGTTGTPKGVMLSHSNFISNAQSTIEYLRLNSNDRVMVILPFYYSYGTSLLTTHILVGGSMVIENSFMYPNVILDKMIEEEVTGFAGVPSTYAILLNRSNIRQYDFPKLRYITQAGGPMSPKHAREISGILNKTEIFVMYGQTEASPRLTYLDAGDFVEKPGFIGKAIPGVEIELIKENGMIAGEGEEGEIVARGGNIMLGYWNSPEETKKVLRDGKLYTGDLAVRDSQGYLKIISRRSDMIKSGAHRISPKEIEEVILELHDVHEVAVVGKDDEILGVIIKAFIVLKDGVQLESKKIQKHCNQRLAPFKIPKEVVFINELPKTSSGKVRKHVLESCETII